MAAIAAATKPKKRGKAAGHTARSMAYLRRDGYLVEKVERPWNPHTKRKQDLFGIWDLIAIDRTVVGVQVTDGDHLAEHRDKLSANPNLRRWLEAGVCGEIHSWTKAGPRGKRKLWKLTVTQAIITSTGDVVWL